MGEGVGKYCGMPGRRHVSGSLGCGSELLQVLVLWFGVWAGGTMGILIIHEGDEMGDGLYRYCDRIYREVVRTITKFGVSHEEFG